MILHSSSALNLFVWRFLSRDASAPSLSFVSLLNLRFNPSSTFSVWATIAGSEFRCETRILALAHCCKFLTVQNRDQRCFPSWCCFSNQSSMLSSNPSGMFSICHLMMFKHEVHLRCDAQSMLHMPFDSDVNKLLVHPHIFRCWVELPCKRKFPIPQDKHWLKMLAESVNVFIT